jgi:hypothetical protein
MEMIQLQFKSKTKNSVWDESKERHVVDVYEEGETYDVPSDFAVIALSNGWAVKVNDNA